MPARMSLNSLTIDHLTRELKARNVSLPKSSVRKEVLIDLYKKHVLNDSPSNTPDVYSSDDDDALKTNPGKNDPYNATKELNEVDIANLTDSELRTKLRLFDEGIGPITNSTRSIYRKKLAKFLSGEIPSPLASAASPTNYSDDEQGTSTHDVSIQNDRSFEDGGGDNGNVDEFDSLRNKQVTEVTRTSYTKTVKQSANWPVGSSWMRKFDDDENASNSGGSSRIKKPSTTLFASDDGVRRGEVGSDNGVSFSTEYRSSPARDYHRRSLAIHGLIPRPPISTYSPPRVATQYSRQSDDAELRHRQTYQSASPSVSLRREPIEPKKFSKKLLLIAVVIIILLCLFGFAVYLNVEPNYLPPRL